MALVAWFVSNPTGIRLAHASTPTYSIVLWKDDSDGRPTVLQAANLAASAISSSDRYAFNLNISSIQLATNNGPNEVIRAYRHTRKQADNLIGVIGPPYSNQLIGAGIVSMDQVPLVSVTATASDPKCKPQNSFHTLLRVVPSDDLTVRALAAVILHYGWEKIAIVRDSSTYAASMSAQLDVGVGLGVLVVDTVCATKEDCSAALRELNDLHHISIFIVWAQLPTTRIILTAALSEGLISTGKAWIGPSHVGDILEGMPASDQAVFSGVAEVSIKIPGREAEKELRTTWLAENPQTFPTSGNIPTEALFAWDAVFALANAVHVQNSTAFNGARIGSPGDVWPSGAEFVESLRSLSFNGASGKVSFNSQNERIWKVYNMKLWNGQGGWTTALSLSNLAPLTENQGHTITKSVTNSLAVSVTELTPPMWPGNTLVVPDGTGLTGKRLQVTVGHYPPYSIVNEEANTFSGFGIDILRNVAEKHGMAINFSFWGLGGSTGMIRDVVTAGNASGTIYDIGAKGFAIDGDRFPDPNTYSVPFSEYKLRLVVPKAPKMEVAPLFGFAGPFDWDVWIACLVTIIVSAALLYMFESGSAVKKGRSGGLATLYDRCNACVGSGGVSVNESELTSSSAKLLFFSTRWFALVILSSYTALLAANLVVVSKLKGIESWEDIVNARVGCYGGGLSEAITRRYATNIKLIQDGKDYSSRTSMLLDLVAGNLDVVTLNPIIASYMISHDERLCGLKIVGEAKGTLPTAFAFNPGLSPAVRRSVNSEITFLRSEFGKPMQNLINGYLAEDNVCHRISAAEQLQESKRMYRLDDFYGLFIVFYGCILGVGLPLHFYEKYKKMGRFKIHKKDPEKMTVGIQEHDDASIELTLQGDNGPSKVDSTVEGKAPSRLARLARVRAKAHAV